MENINALEGENFPRTVIWEFPSYEAAIECHESKEYQDGWAIAKILLKEIYKLSKVLILNRFWIYTSP